VTEMNVNAKRLKTFKKKRANINTACPSVYISVQQSYNKTVFAERQVDPGARQPCPV